MREVTASSLPWSLPARPGPPPVAAGPRRRLRPGAGLGLVCAVLVTACGSDPEAASTVVRPVQADAAGVVAADAWPDACDLAAGPSGPQGPGSTDVRPEDGTLPDGTPLPGARGCSWVQEETERSLRVVIVTTDVQEAWAGYQYLLPLRRPVSDIGDEAFLSPVAGGQEEELWVCRGLTIFTVTAPGLPPEQARTEMFAVAAEAVAALEQTRAGSSPP